jgi:hypothetical protein
MRSNSSIASFQQRARIGRSWEPFPSLFTRLAPILAGSTANRAVLEMKFMVSTIRLYVDAAYAVAIMAVVSVLSGALAASITGNTQHSLQVALAMFAVTGALLAVRLWRVTRERPTAVSMRTVADDARPH